MSELWRMGAAQLAALIRFRKVSCREVVDAFLLRIPDANHNLNAVTVTLDATAIESADAADRTLKAGDLVSELLVFRLR